VKTWGSMPARWHGCTSRRNREPVNRLDGWRGIRLPKLEHPSPQRSRERLPVHRVGLAGRVRHTGVSRRPSAPLGVRIWLFTIKLRHYRFGGISTATRGAFGGIFDRSSAPFCSPWPSWRRLSPPSGFDGEIRAQSRHSKARIAGKHRANQPRSWAAWLAPLLAVTFGQSGNAHFSNACS
jgi:hypothetical protein